MSGGHQMLLGGGRGIGANLNKSFAAVISKRGAGTQAGSINWHPDGTTVYNQATAPTAGPNWYIPTTTNAGANWSRRLTLISQQNSSFSGATPGFWDPASVDHASTVQNSPSTATATGSAKVEFSPDGGTTIIEIGTVSWTVGP